MKKKLLFASLVLAIGSTVFAQSSINHDLTGRLKSVSPKKTLPSSTPSTRNMTCSNDTLNYALLKEELVSAAAPNYGGFGLMTGSSSFGSAYSQAFLSSGPVTINAVQFWGLVNDAINPVQTLTVNVSVYNVNATNIPTTQVATTTALLVGTTDDFYTAIFPTPPTVNGNYAIVIENTSTTDTLAVVVNNAETTTYAEGLAGLKYAGTWYPITAALPAPAAYEAILAPIVSYPIATNFTTSANPVCLGTSITFTNTTTPSGVLGSRMSNWNKFNDYWSLAVDDSTYFWNMGDASAVVWTANTTKNYAAAGTYNVTLTTLGGLWNSCMDTKTTAVVVNPIDNATITPHAPLCQSASPVNLSAATTGGTWSGPGITSAALGTFDPSASGVGTHIITYTTNGACPASDTETITVIPNEDATISDPGMICAGDATFNLTAATAGGTWSGTGITNSTNGTFSPSVAGSGEHVITYVTSGTCVGTDTIHLVVSVCAGVQGHDAVATMSVYPNPSKGVFNVDLGMSIKSTMEIYNILGSKVFAKEANTQTSSIDLSGFEAGIYILKVKTDKGQTTKQITITK
jgi:hypothetical protein